MAPQFVVDPFTLTALIGIAIWLDRRLRSVESKVAYTEGFSAGRNSLNSPPSKQTAIEQ